MGTVQRCCCHPISEITSIPDGQFKGKNKLTGPCRVHFRIQFRPFYSGPKLSSGIRRPITALNATSVATQTRTVSKRSNKNQSSPGERDEAAGTSFQWA